MDSSFVGFVQGKLAEHGKEFRVLKAELDKIAVFGRKLEHCLVDINSIRDAIYRQNDQVQEEEPSVAVDPISFVRGEIESLQLLTR